MYILIGGDGKEYGPADAAQIRSWIAAGRADLNSQAKLSDSTEWKRLGDFPEFGGNPSQPPPLHPAADDALAGRWIRLGARLLDGVFSLFLIGPGLFGLLPWLKAHPYYYASGGFADVPTKPLLLCAAGGLIVTAIQIYLLTTRGQTVGKLICRIKIVRVDGAPAGFVRAWLLRYLVVGVFEGIPILGPILAIFDILFIFSDSRRCLHDWVAGTKVVRAELN